jgi:hypothetical protein
MEGVMLVPGFVAVGLTWGTNPILALSWSPLASPKAIVHVAPAAVWAVVGGQGKLSAAVRADVPALSVPVEGGPVYPVTILNVALSVPVDDVETVWASGLVQLTGTWLPATPIVGWLPALLHSAIPPGLFSFSPVPVMVTTSPPLRHVPGSTVICTVPALAWLGSATHGMVELVEEVALDALVVVDLAVDLF